MAAETKTWGNRASAQDGAYCPGGTKSSAVGAHKRPTHDFWDPGRDSFLSLNGEKAIKAVADELFPASGSDPHGVWTHFPSKNVYTSPQRRTISTAMTLFANQPEVHGHVCPWVHEVVHTTSDLGLDALQLKDFTSKYAASTGYQDEHGAWETDPYLESGSKLEHGFKFDLSRMPNKWSTSAEPTMRTKPKDMFWSANGSYVTYVEQSFLADMEPKCAVQAGTKFSYVKPCVNKIPWPKKLGIPADSTIATTCGKDEEGTPELENRLSAAKWFMMNQKAADQIYVTHSGAPAS